MVKPRVSILAVGDELLLGRCVDTNSSWLARRCSDLGLEVVAMRICGDDQAELVAALSSACALADLVLATGGLGPTEDDRTRHALAELMAVPLDESAQALRSLEAYWRRLGRSGAAPLSNRRQILLPRGARLLSNDRGTAPGILARWDSTFIACMPGVPHEMRAMAQRLFARLGSLLPELPQSTLVELHVGGLGESRLQDLIGDLAAGLSPRVGITAHEEGHITLRLVGSASAVRRRAGRLRRLLRSWLLPENGLAPSLVAELTRRRWTVTAAESCTCGLVLAALGSVPGASRVLREGVIAYDNAVKIARLEVDADTLRREGAVSEAVVRQMAEGARRGAGADLALASSGIAGPDGGSRAKPVGTVWLAAATAGRTEARLVQLRGDRIRIQHRAAAEALRLGWELLQEG